MKIAILCAKSWDKEMSPCLPPKAGTLLSWGDDTVARRIGRLAAQKRIPHTHYSAGEALTDEQRFDMKKMLLDRADMTYIFWNGPSASMERAVEYAEKNNRPVKLFIKG